MGGCSPDIPRAKEIYFSRFGIGGISSDLDNFPTQHFAAKERVVVELASPGRAYEGEIINDQQDGANHRSQQETTLNGFAAVIHKG
jgi:hypothetical protein